MIEENCRDLVIQLPDGRKLETDYINHVGLDPKQTGQPGGLVRYYISYTDPKAQASETLYAYGTHGIALARWCLMGYDPNPALRLAPEAPLAPVDYEWTTPEKTRLASKCFWPATEEMVEEAERYAEAHGGRVYYYIEDSDFEEYFLERVGPNSVMPLHEALVIAVLDKDCPEYLNVERA